MCLILFSYQDHPEYRLILAANRDEFYERPTLPATMWDDEDFIAGKDLKAGGTWIGVHKEGRLGALTNYRDPSTERDRSSSRGELVVDYLRSINEPRAYLDEIRESAEAYNGFNVLVGDTDSLWYYSNKQHDILPVTPGVHGLSNHLLNTPWPKVQRGTSMFETVIRSETLNVETLFEVLLDDQIAPDSELPSTGVPIEWERTLSPMFIRSSGYGTRCSTVITLRKTGEMEFYERTYPVGGGPSKTLHFTL